MKKKLLVLGIAMLLAAAPVFAWDINIDLSGLPAPLAPFKSDLEAALEAETIGDLSMPRFMTGMSNASSFAADGATQRNFIGYRFFALGAGTMAGAQLPSSNMESAIDRLVEEGDIFAGTGIQALSVSLGVNLGFLVDRLYVSGKFGTFSMDFDDFNISTSSFGLFAHYQLIKPRSRLLAAWRGVQAGTGFIYYKSDVTFNFEAPPVESIIEAGEQYVTLFFEPDLAAKFTTYGVKVPIDIMTGVRLAIFNFSLGLGADINVTNNSSLNLSASSLIYYEASGSYSGSGTAGSVSISGGPSGSADRFKFKAMAGVGLSLGIIRLDVPITYYFGKGIGGNVGITGGIVF
ncbi:MAG: hypothetical protein FWC36_00600 [Spirochaetes bacterium]|nr:hypothetical protein [Spirochaetota bacterium]